MQSFAQRGIPQFCILPQKKGATATLRKTECNAIAPSTYRSMNSPEISPVEHNLYAKVPTTLHGISKKLSLYCGTACRNKKRRNLVMR